MSLFVNVEGGLTTAGYTCSAILIFAILMVIAAISGKGKPINAKTLAFSAAAIALAFVTSFVAVLHMPMGGAVTLFSMLFVVLVGYWYGPAVGLMAGVAYGLLQLIQNPYIVSIPQMLVDYVFAFGALGLSGFFHNRKHGLIKGYVLAVFGRFFFAVLSGIIFFGQYAPEGMNPLTYSVVYNGTYLGLEAFFTILLLLVPPVSKALVIVKTQACSN